MRNTPEVRGFWGAVKATLQNETAMTQVGAPSTICPAFISRCKHRCTHILACCESLQHSSLPEPPYAHCSARVLDTRGPSISIADEYIIAQLPGAMILPYSQRSTPVLPTYDHHP